MLRERLQARSHRNVNTEFTGHSDRKHSSQTPHTQPGKGRDNAGAPGGPCPDPRGAPAAPGNPAPRPLPGRDPGQRPRGRPAGGAAGWRPLRAPEPGRGEGARPAGAGPLGVSPVAEAAGAGGQSRPAGARGAGGRPGPAHAARLPPVYRRDQSDASRPAPRRARPGSTAPEVPRVAMGTRRGLKAPRPCMSAPIDLYVRTATARGVGAAEPRWAQLRQACFPGPGRGAD